MRAIFRKPFLRQPIRTVFTDIHVHPAISEAIQANKPIVALESTIISHGMPYPKNLEVALALEDTIKMAGAVPCTTAIIDGFPRVGLEASEFELLASGKTPVLKASRRDIAHACANRLNAATTVSSTMLLAAMAGVRVFATGGIGGVHRGAEVTMDISADLTELSRTPVTVVCSGVKSILDIPKTLEVLETLGVPVYGYKTDEFPAFFTNSSGVKSPLVANSSLAIARAMACQDDLRGLSGEQGMLVAVPNPNPADTESIEAAVHSALTAAAEKGISGAAVTPFVLSYVKELTEGRSLEANVALVMNNAKVAAQIAVEYAPLSPRRPSTRPVPSTKHAVPDVKTSVPSSQPHTRAVPDTVASSSHSVVVFGAAVVDHVIAPQTGVPLLMGTSNPGVVSTNYGGVGRNIAESLARLGGCRPHLVSVVGGDIAGGGVLQHAEGAGVDVSGVVRAGDRTATYVAVHDHEGDLVLAVADMDIFQKYITPELVRFAREKIAAAELVVVDGNLSVESFVAVASSCHEYDVPLFFEPTSVPKCTLPVLAKSLDKIDIIKPNIAELCAIIESVLSCDSMVFPGKAALHLTLDRLKNSKPGSVSVSDVRQMACGLLSIMLSGNKPRGTVRQTRRVTGKHVIVSMGRDGVLWAGPPRQLGQDADTDVNDMIACRHISVTKIPDGEIKNTSGAGDSFCAGIIHGLMPGRGSGPNLQTIISGIQNAEKALRSDSTVPQSK